MGDPDEPLDISSHQTGRIAEWYALGSRVLDAVLQALPETSEPATQQLWPEHFDLGTNIALSDGGRVNLGCSPGDAYEAQPYLYVGPWGAERPGDPSYWNAPFGAVLRSSDLVSSVDALESGVRFARTGLDFLSGQVVSK